MMDISWSLFPAEKICAPKRNVLAELIQRIALLLDDYTVTDMTIYVYSILRSVNANTQESFIFVFVRIASPFPHRPYPQKISDFRFYIGKK